MITVHDYRQPYPNELYHYGVVGMKWGVRRYQNADGTYTEAGKLHYRKSSPNVSEVGRDRFGAGHKAAVITRNVSLAATTGFTAANYLLLRAGLWSPYTLAGNAVSAGVMVTSSAIVDKIETKKLKLHGEPHEDPNYEMPLKKKKMSPEKDLREVNDGHGAKGSVNNCLFCSASYELRRRGYDVMAELSEKGNNEKKLEKYFKNAKIEHFVDISDDGKTNLKKMFDSTDENLNKVKALITDAGDGARGYLGLSWGKQYSRFGDQTFYVGSHATTWENLNGKIVIREAQSGRTIDFDSYFHQSNSEETLIGSPTSFMRWDNLEFNKTAISEAVFKEDEK